MSSKPTFIFVPGNFLPPSYYANITKLLETHGFQTRLVTLPSTGSKSPLSSNEPDIDAIQQTIRQLSDSGKEIIVVAHSYGCIPTCEAVKGFAGVARLILIAAWLLREGESPPDIIGRHNIEAPWVRFEGGNVFADDPVHALHNDTSADVAAYWSSYITHSDLAAFSTPLKYAAWRHIPTTYLLCELDKCISPHAQEGMLALTEGIVKTIRLPSGHMPMLSMPEKVVNILREEAGKAS